MPENSDLYATLGLRKGASEEEIRRAYRKLARQSHPDVNPGNAAAEENFKRVAAAYDVLSHKERRALYDEFGDEGLRGGFDPEQARSYRRWAEGRQATGAQGDEVPFDFDLGDLFGAARGEPGRRARGRVRRSDVPIAGEDIAVPVELDFATALRGAEVEARVPLQTPCTTCAGSGESPGSQPETCPECSGEGRTQVVQGPLRFTTTCARCGGDGKVHAPCETCGGQGVLQQEQTVRVRIPPGADDGSELRVRGKGGPGLFGGAAGDLLIRTRVQPHPYFRRDGLDLHLKLPITFGEAYLGASIPVPTPSGPVQMKVRPRTKPGAKLRLKGKGVQRGEARGELYVELEVQVPDLEDAKFEQAIAESERLYSRPVREAVTL